VKKNDGDRPTKKLRIALLHLSPIPGDLYHNRSLIKQAIKVAAAGGAHWVVSPELGVCGYQFARLIGTDWIAAQPDGWMTDFCHPERERQTDKLYNSVFLIDPEGEIVCAHRKINVLTGSESWSSPGEGISPVEWRSLKIGVLVCADAATKDIADTLKAKGAQILISPAAWGPGLYGPSGEWEQRTRDTGLPLIVCNRTGEEEGLSFLRAESVVVKNGRRVLSHHSERSVVLTFEVHGETLEILSTEYHRQYL
jgi:predicted amidohydrolase